MRRLFWVALGAAAGVVVVRRIGQVARTYGPEGIARSAAGMTEALREVGQEIRVGMAEREEELRLALGVDAGTEPDPGRGGAAGWGTDHDPVI